MSGCQTSEATTIKLQSLLRNLKQQMSTEIPIHIHPLCTTLFKKYGYTTNDSRTCSNEQIYGIDLASLATEHPDKLRERLERLQVCRHPQDIQANTKAETITKSMQKLIVQAFIDVHNSLPPKIDAIWPEAIIRLRKLGTKITKFAYRDVLFRGLEECLLKRGSPFSQVVAIYALDRAGESDRFKDIPHDENVLCYHGTKADRLCSILQSGLKIDNPHTGSSGSTYGLGIYFTNCITGIAQFCDPGDWSLCYVLIAELNPGPVTTSISDQKGGRTTVSKDWNMTNYFGALPDGTKILASVYDGRIVIKDEGRIKLRFLAKCARKVIERRW